MCLKLQSYNGVKLSSYMSVENEEQNHSSQTQNVIEGCSREESHIPSKAKFKKWMIK